jgi:TPP-dependent pyruvate/acetoin dehydrogenase alpha subunit
MEHYLTARNLWTDQWKKELTAEINREIDEAITFAENSPKPKPDEALDHVYSFSIRERELKRRVWSPRSQRGSSWR